MYGMAPDGLSIGLAAAANPADRQRLMTTAATAIDEAQLLTGQSPRCRDRNQSRRYVRRGRDDMGSH